MLDLKVKCSRCDALQLILTVIIGFRVGDFVGELVEIDVGSGVGVIVDKGGEGFEVGDAV